MLIRKLTRLSGYALIGFSLLFAGCQTGNPGGPDTSTPVVTNTPVPTKGQEATKTPTATLTPTNTPSPTEEPLKEAREQDFKYIVENGEVTILGLLDESVQNLSIPETIDGYPVTEIEDRAFYGTGIKKVHIPKTITLIGWGAFSGCTNLKSIVVDEENKWYFSVDEKGEECNAIISQEGWLIQGCATTKIPEGDYRTLLEKKYNIEMEDSFYVYRISREAFLETEIESVVIPYNIEEIEFSAFERCRKLESVTFEEGVRIIQNQAFMNCTNLTKVVLSGTIDVIGDHVWSGCNKLKEITIPKKAVDSYADLWAKRNGYSVVYK